MIRFIGTLLNVLGLFVLLSGSAVASDGQHSDWHFEIQPQAAYDFQIGADRNSGSVISKFENGLQIPAAQVTRIFKVEELRGKQIQLTMQIRIQDVSSNAKIFFSSFSADSKNNIYKNLLENKAFRSGEWDEFKVNLVVPQDSHTVALNFLITGSIDLEFKDISLTALPFAERPASKGAKAYFDHAIQIIQKRHVDSRLADWSRILADAELILNGAETSVDTYPAIRSVLVAVGNKHSFLITPSNSHIRPSAGGDAVLPTWQLVERRFGRVRLPGLRASYDKRSLSNMKNYVSALKIGLQQMDKADLCGWIVDLRDNDGGNMWPMLVGVAPLLDNEIYGYFVTNDGKQSPWTRRAVIATGKQIYGKKTLSYFQLENDDRPIAVLIGPLTGSSGEMVALSFKGRNNTRFFGLPTYGLTSGNETFHLSDGAQLVLTTSYIKDVDGKIYKNQKIQPDQLANDNNAEELAVNWLSTDCKMRFTE